jgi:sugar O-acyltransferase (sialic acid O-acetyltransferase NeuD family)
MSEPLVVVGAGGFGREVLDVVDAVNGAADAPLWEVIGVVDDGPTSENLERLSRRGVRHIGGVDEYLERGPSASYVVGVGAPRVRCQIVQSFDRVGHIAATLIHPSVTCGFDVAIDVGTVACAGVRLTTNIRIGRHVHLNPNVTVGHDSVLHDCVSVNPHASISGDCIIEEQVLIGVGGVILNGLVVGAQAVVGGSACVVRNVEPGTTVVGVPARPIAG